MVIDSRLAQLIGARLDRVILYAASVSLEFEKGDSSSFTLSTSCDFLVAGDTLGGEYPLSADAFAQLASAIDGCVEELSPVDDGDYELRIAGRTFTLKNEGAMSGIFRLSGQSVDQPQWDEFF